MEKIIYRKTLDVHKNGIQFTLQGFETNDNMSRRIEISLMASGDTYDLPLEGVVALMYITTPNADETITRECTIRDNTIVYDMFPIAEKGITEMQLKLIKTSVEGAKAVLISPRFAVEVTESKAVDTDAEQTTAFTDLENAVAKAMAVYNERITGVELTDNLEFKVTYADGGEYITDAIARKLTEVTTGMDLSGLLQMVLSKLTAADVAKELETTFKPLLGQALYATDLAATYNVPTFVRWDENTYNTPYKAGKTNGKSGYAIVYGDCLTNHTVNAWVVGGGSNFSFTHLVIGGKNMLNGKSGADENTPYDWDDVWDQYMSASGGTITGGLNIKRKWATLSLSDDTNRKAMLEKGPDGWTILHNYKDSNNHNSLVLAPETSDLEDLAELHHAVEGNDKTYRLYGEHNVPHPAQIFTGTYEGTGEGSDAYNKTITPPFKPQIVYLEGHIAVRPSGSAYKAVPSLVTKANVSWSESNNSVTFSRVTGTSGSGTKFNEKGRIYTYTIVG